MIKLGNLKLKNKMFLAPMHQVNDAAFRMLCKKAGAGAVYTGLINPLSKEKFCFEDKPAVQFACNSASGIEEFIKKYDKKILFYDFNLGCPSTHAKTTKIGYFMISDFEIIETILKTIRANTKKPITIKIRKINDEKTLNNLLKIAEKYCDAVSVHPRTQPQGYSGIPDVEFARRVKKLTKLPVIYSGNINSREEAEKMLKEFDFIMIGRMAIGNPGIFSELVGKKLKRNITFNDWLRLYSKLEGKPDFPHMKFQALNFTKGFNGAARKRYLISNAKTEKELLEIIKS